MPGEVAVFLALGVALSLGSKLLQFVPALRQRAWLGNVLVLPAAAFLVLAALFALPPFRDLHAADATRAWALACLVCLAVMSFQVVMMRLLRSQQ